jgi:hypothetical protein
MVLLPIFFGFFYCNAIDSFSEQIICHVGWLAVGQSSFYLQIHKSQIIYLLMILDLCINITKAK